MSDRDDPAPITERVNRQLDWSREQSLFVRVPPIPHEMLIELSNACNHACIFCTNTYMKRKVGRIDSGLLFRVLEEARNAGVREVGFYTTGEPFIHKDLEAFVRRAAELGYVYIFVTTNGALAVPERSKAVIDAGLNSIKFSINAATAATYATIHGRDDFEKVLTHLRFVSEYRHSLGRPLRLSSSFVVNDLNRHEIELAKEVIGSLVDEQFFFDCNETQMGQLPSLTEALGAPPDVPRGDICPLPFDRLHVSQEGYLNLCCTDYHNYLAVADLNGQSLTEAWASPVFQDARQRHIDKRLENTVCGKCMAGLADEALPFVPDFATKVNFAEFDSEVLGKIQQRIDAGKHGRR